MTEITAIFGYMPAPWSQDQQFFVDNPDRESMVRIENPNQMVVIVREDKNLNRRDYYLNKFTIEYLNCQTDLHCAWAVMELRSLKDDLSKRPTIN